MFFEIFARGAAPKDSLMLITNYLAAVPEMVPFIDASKNHRAAMHSTSRPAAAGRSSGASKETPNGCWKKMAPLHQLEANTFMPGSPSPGSDLSEFFEEFEDRSLICWCGSSKNSFSTTSEWWKLYVMSTFQWRLPSVHGVAKVVNTVARLPGNADSHELRILQLLTWWCWERSPTRQSFHQIMEGNKHTHTHLFTTAFGLVKHLFMGL